MKREKKNKTRRKKEKRKNNKEKGKITSSLGIR